MDRRFLKPPHWVCVVSGTRLGLIRGPYSRH